MSDKAISPPSKGSLNPEKHTSQPISEGTLETSVLLSQDEHLTKKIKKVKKSKKLKHKKIEKSNLVQVNASLQTSQADPQNELRDNIVKIFLAPLLTTQLAIQLTQAIVTDMQPALYELAFPYLRQPLTVKLDTIISGSASEALLKILPNTIPHLLDRLLPMLVINTMANVITETLTRSLTHSVALTVSSTWHHISQGERINRNAFYMVDYDAAFFSDYYADYYTGTDELPNGNKK